MTDRENTMLSQPPEQLKTPATTRIFYLTLAVFLLASVALSWVNRSPGSADSCANLTLARNITQGRGYVTYGVGQLWEPQPIPAPETIKPPGLAYLTAALFALFGPGLSIPVLFNAAMIASTAILLRLSVKRTSEKRLGDLAGILILASRNQEMVSLWNNNVLTACHAALLLILAVGSGGAGTVLALAGVSAFGFLMKPTFLLSAIPFAFLVLTANPAATRAYRAQMLVMFLTLFTMLTAPYWLTNLIRYGNPLYAPGFTSGRLAVRYNILGSQTWTTLRWGRPMTYGEVVQTLGLVGMLIADAKMIFETAYYTVALNPAVTLIAGFGFLLFRQPSHWKEYLGPFLLAAAIAFETGIYNHHEARYLWPIYPCTLALAALGIRDFAAWGQPRMADDLASRFRAVVILTGILALGFGSLGAAVNWRNFVREARAPIPEWVTAVQRLPQNAIILVGNTPSLGWWTDRATVICPTSSRDDLFHVISAYRVTHILVTDSETQQVRDNLFQPEELHPLNQGNGWKLYQIQP